MEILFGIAIFILILSLIEGSYFIFRLARDPEKRKIRRRLQSLSMDTEAGGGIDLVRKKIYSQVPLFQSLLSRWPWADRLHRFVEQGDARYPLGAFLLLSLILGLIGLVVGAAVSDSSILSLLSAALGGSLPFVHMALKRKKRMEKFQRQFPEAMDLIARSLKAGHAFSAGLKMVSDELDDPIGAEFEKTVNEINFGVGVPEALQNLCLRVDCPDLKFFVVSVTIQRETGGNLAEILENIAYIIRERFKLQGRIKVLAAEGKFSAGALIVIPLLVSGALLVLNPGYIGVLFEDPIGKAMVAGAVMLMALGCGIMAKMVKIKV